MAFWQHRFSFAFSVLLSFHAFAHADESSSRQAEEKFLAARKQFQKEKSNFDSAWKFGQSCFDWAEFAQSDQQRETIANQGIDACRRAIQQQPKAIAGHYYLAMNLGQLARTKTIGALKLVDQMEVEFKIARDIDAKFDFAGPERNLGLLYRDAPGWPASIGNRSKARLHLERAVKLSPNYPENHLNLLEAYLKWGDKNAAQRAFKALKEIWDAAKKEFSGEPWASSWADWERRLEQIQGKVTDAPKILETPRQKN